MELLPSGGVIEFLDENNMAGFLFLNSKLDAYYRQKGHLLLFKKAMHCWSGQWLLLGLSGRLR